MQTDKRLESLAMVRQVRCKSKQDATLRGRILIHSSNACAYNISLPVCLLCIFLQINGIQGTILHLLSRPKRV